MKPRFTADYRMLFWMLVLVPTVPTMALVDPAIAPWLLCFGLYLAYCVGIASHCHNHCPVFRRRAVNRAYSLWLSVFYGYPTFAWIPTHNQNHHKFTNAEGDLTRTTRYAQHDSLWVALTYPMASAVYQAPAIQQYVQLARRNRPGEYRFILAQCLVVALAHTSYLCAAIWLHGLELGLLAFLCGAAIPALFATWSMIFTNYVQHVGCDPDSPDDHSRNFVHPWLNWLAFDAGFHTVHHEHPGTHWSRYRALHQARAAAIKPELNQSSIFGFCWTRYLRPSAHCRTPVTD